MKRKPKCNNTRIGILTKPIKGRADLQGDHVIRMYLRGVNEIICKRLGVNENPC